MKNETRLDQRQQEECLPTTATRKEEHLFPTPEEALRADRQATAVPPELTERIAESLGSCPPVPHVAWWKRLLGLRP